MPLKIYKSSAGSGKTFTLTKEYIKILLRNPYAYKNVLAITFTNKSTSEMKNRILEELSGISENKRSDLQISLEDDFSKTNEQIDIVKHADLAFRNILHNYARFEVSTIDSFFTRVVKSCAHELGLSSRYEIELGNDPAIEYAIRKLYKDLKEESETGRWLKEFSLSQIEKDKGWDVDYQITDLAKELFKEKIQMGFQDGFLELEKVKEKISGIKDLIKNFEQGARKRAKKCLEIIHSHGLSNEDFIRGSRGFASVYYKIADGKFELTNTFRKVIEENEGWYAKKSPNIDQIDRALDNGLLERSQDLLEFYHQHWKDYTSAQEVLKNYYSYALLGALNENVKSYRDENDLLLLSDTNSIIRQTIQEDDAPFLFEKIGSRYEHILIDEFQDTSSFQWENLKPLILSSLSAGNNVLIVGDVKQSIYRWRGGDMNLLLNQVQSDLEIYHNETQEIILNDNWRSGQEIVLFNNQFFPQAIDLLKNLDDIQESRLFDKAYADINQNPKSSNNGYVQIDLLNKDDYEDFNLAFLEKLLNQINACTCDEYNYSDIMVLVDRGARAMEIAEFLSEKRIPCVTENSLLLKNNPLIDLLVALIKSIKSPEELFYKTQSIIKYADWKGLAELDLTDLSSTPSLQKVFDFEGLQSKSPYDLVQELLNLLEIEKKDVYVQTFLNNLSQLGKKGIISINQFLEWWEMEQDSLKVEGQNEAEAVQILTVHKSKGLESPIVIIPFADFSMKTKGGTTIWSENLPSGYSEFNMLPLNFSEKLKESGFSEVYYEEFIQGLLDRVNVAYVAFTRAKERLYISGEKVNKQINDPTKLNLLLQLILENSSFPFHSYYDSEAGLFRYGTKHKKKQESVSVEKDTYKLGSSSSTDTNEKIQLQTQSDQFFRLFETDSSERIKKGLKIHLVFEHLYSREDLAKAIDHLLHEGLLEKTEAREIAEDVESILRIPEVAKWFETDWEVIREKEIWYDGRIYKPDRVLMKGDEAIIIDFKKDKESNDHKHQLNAYAEVIRKMGFDKIRKYLLYVESRKVLKVA